MLEKIDVILLLGDVFMKLQTFLVGLVIILILISGCAQQKPISEEMPEGILLSKEEPLSEELPEIPSTQPTTQPPIETPTTTQLPETPTPTQTSTINFLTYENPTYGIRIKYPRDWERKEAPDMIGFFSSEKDASFIANVFDISTNPVTVEEYKQHLVNQCKMPDCNIIDSGDATLANNPAYKLVFTEEGPFNMMIIFTIKDNKLYLLTYTAGLNEYSKYLDIINEMIDSFEII